MTKLLLIAAGGACGALLRYVLSGLTYRVLDETFPWGTLVVNVFGCLLIGVLWATSERVAFSPNASIFVFTGTLGAFTTFSTYGLESINLLRDGEIGLGLANIVASNLVGLAAVLIGFGVAHVLFTHAGGAS